MRLQEKDMAAAATVRSTGSAVYPHQNLPRPVRIPPELFCQSAEDPRSEVMLFFNEIRAAAVAEASDYDIPSDCYLAVEDLVEDNPTAAVKRTKVTKVTAH